MMSALVAGSACTKPPVDGPAEGVTGVVDDPEPPTELVLVARLGDGCGVVVPPLLLLLLLLPLLEPPP